MNNDLISRDALKEALHNFFDGKVIDEPTYILRDVFSYIDNAPTIEQNWKFYYDHGYKQAEKDLKRPTGEWEEPFESHGKTFHKCNHCHLSSLATLFDNFCPNCGAAMQKGEENEVN